MKISTCAKREEEAPRRPPGSSSVEPKSCILWCPSETKLAVSERGSSRGSMLTRQLPVNAGAPDWRARLTSTRIGVFES